MATILEDKRTPTSKLSHVLTRRETTFLTDVYHCKLSLLESDLEKLLGKLISKTQESSPLLGSLADNP